MDPWRASAVMRARAFLVTVAVLTTGLAGCLADDEPVTPARTGPPPLDTAGLSEIAYDTITRVSLNVTSSVDDTELTTHVYKPDAEGPFPTILVLSPYWSFLGDSKDDDMNEGYPTWYIEYFVPRGYAVALGEMRGTRSSGGCWDFGGELDQADGHDIVQHLAGEAWSNGKVGMLGQSHVGMSQIAAAITAPENLTTIVPIAAVSDWYRYLHKDGAPYETNRATPPAYFAVHASPATDPVTDGQPTPGWVLTQARTACEDNLVHLSQSAELDGDKDAYWQERDLIAGAPNITASVFLVHGFLDENVKTDHVLDLWQALPEDVETRAWFGQWFHEHPAFHEWRDALHAWFDHELMGIDNNVTQQPRVTVQTSDGTARTEADWPPANTTDEAWTLREDGTLASGSTGAATGEVTYLEVPGDDRGTPATPGLPRRVTFTTDTLDQRLHLAGEPTLTLEGTLDQPVGRWIAVLYDVAPDGERDEITRAYLDAEHRETNRRSEPVPTGEALTYELSFYPRDHVVEPGHRLRLALLGGDLGCEVAGSTCEGTGIVPVDRPVQHTVTVGPGSPTALWLPVLEDPGPTRELTELDGWLDDVPD